MIYLNTILIVLVLVSLSIGVYRLKKHSDKVRKKMMDEVDEMENEPPT